MLPTSLLAKLPAYDAAHWRPAAAALLSVASMLALTLGLSAARSSPVGSDEGARRVAASTHGDLREAALERMVAQMDPATVDLGRRFDPLAQDEEGRSFSLEGAEPNLFQLLPAQGAEAQRINEAIPFTDSRVLSAAPFVLKARNDAERERAVRCLANAIYYEAALEPVDGQRAVAQVVVNRVRDPNFPKSVCGVVYEGWERVTGCQFSFTCDGALASRPIPVLWQEVRRVAEAALNGSVQPAVGTATHYHADYVSPYWAPSLVKISQIGAHIFYRWPGNAGLPTAFTASYAGGEMRLSEAVLSGRAARPAAASTAAEAVGARTVRVADAGGHTQTRVQGSFEPAQYGRRQPSPDEVARINALLEQRFPTAVPAKPEPAAAQAAPTAPAPAVESAIG
jgi:spore germination cell wall hydrolase CwlJ-like protein